MISGAAVTANFFHALGVKPILGRTFTGTEDGIDDPSSAARVCVIGYRLWQERLGGDPNVLGGSLTLNQTAYTIIGVMPASFWFSSRNTQVWVPISVERANREYRYITAVGRRKTALPQSSADMAALAQAFGQTYPQTNKGWTIEVQDLHEWVANRTFRSRILLLAGALGLILLIACSNAASLLLARAGARRREIATRISLGATRARLVRQLLTESLVLALAGGGAGLALGRILIRGARVVLPPNAITNVSALELNMGATLFTLAVALVTGLIFGLAPSVAMAGANVQNGLRDSARSISGGRSRQRLRRIVVTAEVALAFLLLASTGLMLKSLRKLAEADLGFRPQNLLAWSLFLPAGKYDAEAALQVHRRALVRVAALPGVESVTVASGLPLSEVTMEVPFNLERTPQDFGERPGAGYQSISPEYLKTLGIPLKRGRAFTEADNENTQPVAIVNDAFIERFLSGRDAVGEPLVLNRPLLRGNGFGPPVRASIVGVIPNVALGHLPEDPLPTIYVPHAQNVWRSTAWFAVRTRSDPSIVAAAVRREMDAIASGQPIENLNTMEQVFYNQFAEPRFQTQLMAAFAALALLLALSGVYSINADAVAQRKHEIGLRMALGASPSQVMNEIIAGSLQLTSLGIGIGVLGAFVFAYWLKSVIAAVSPTDPITMGETAIMLAAVSMLASAIPAFGATRIDPAIALRQE
jgi:putative ABC transport system permease protein